MLKDTKNTLIQYAYNLEPGAERARCYKIIHYSMSPSETIADRLIRSHASQDEALRDACLMVEAKCAEENNKRGYFYGTFTFEDGSRLN